MGSHDAPQGEGPPAPRHASGVFSSSSAEDRPSHSPPTLLLREKCSSALKARTEVPPPVLRGAGRSHKAASGSLGLPGNGAAGGSWDPQGRCLEGAAGLILAGSRGWGA